MYFGSKQIVEVQIFLQVFSRTEDFYYMYFQMTSIVSTIIDIQLTADNAVLYSK